MLNSYNVWNGIIKFTNSKTQPMKPPMKKKGQSYFDLPEKERRRILKAAGEHAQKMQQDLIKKADAMKQTSDYREVDRRLTTLIKDNLWGLVCDKCTGGGWDHDEKEKCKQCGGCGIYDWRVEPLLKLFHSELDRVREETIKECLGALPCKDSETYHYDFSWKEAIGFNNAISLSQTALTQLN